MSSSDLKVIKKIILLVVFQSVLFFFAKISPFTVHILKSDFDLKIPFIQQFIFFYASWYIMLFLIPFIYNRKDPEVFKKYFIASNLSIIVAFFIYFFYPTAIVRGNVFTKSISGFVTNIIYKIDTPAVNCFPSMHCILCFFYIFYILKAKNTSIFVKIAITLWALVIVLSTLLVKQHVLLDVISAFVLSFAIFIIVEIVYKKKALKS